MIKYTFNVLRDDGNVEPVTVHAGTWRVAMILLRGSLGRFGWWRTSNKPTILDIDAFDTAGRRCYPWYESR